MQVICCIRSQAYATAQGCSRKTSLGDTASSADSIVRAFAFALVWHFIEHKGMGQSHYKVHESCDTLLTGMRTRRPHQEPPWLCVGLHSLQQ